MAGPAPPPPSAPDAVENPLPAVAAAASAKAISAEQTANDPHLRAAAKQRRVLIIVSVATVFALSTWFSLTAVADALQDSEGLSKAEIAWAAVATQLGFVLGTLCLAFTNIADLISPRWVFAGSALLAALLNASTIPAAKSAWGLALPLVRLLLGAFLGGVYPPAMKILSGWYTTGRGFALGTMVGALTLGSGSPHLIKYLVDPSGDEEEEGGEGDSGRGWEWVLLACSILSVLAGGMVFALVADGPFESRAAQFNPAAVITVLRQRGQRLVMWGYFGHMWELYAMWAWIATFLEEFFPSDASLVTFFVFLSGAFACPAAGLLAERFGRTVVTSAAMIMSGGIAAGIGFIPSSGGDGAADAVVVLSLLWGASVVADSAQFSTCVTELCDPHYRGSVLAVQTGLGFALTAVTIRLVPVVEDAAGWGPAFLLLALGPLVGTISMLTLRQTDDALLLAHGKK